MAIGNYIYQTGAQSSKESPLPVLCCWTEYLFPVKDSISVE